MEKQEFIKEKAIQLGANSNEWRKWKHRGHIPLKWQVRIFTATNGAISLSEMDSIFKEKRNET